MANLKVEIKKAEDRSKVILDAIKELKSLEAVVGIPQETNARQEGSPITNAELLYIHSNGSPVNNIPPREVLEPAIKDDKKVISDLLKQAGERAFNGDKEGLRKGLEKAGLRAENSAKAWFTNPKNGWAENSEITIDGSRKDNNGAQFIKGKGKSKNRPLIDTGQLRASITHVVRKKG